MPLLTVLPGIAFALLAAGFRYRGRGRDGGQGWGWRESAIFASIPWAVFLTLLTELLTQMRALTRAGVAIGWAMAATAALAWMLTEFRGWRRTGNAAARGCRPARTETIFFLVVGLLLFATGLTAVISAPNNWDAMEYHLPRVVEWVSQRGVQFYPTVDWFQLDQPPMAEYTMLHLYLLYGGDRLVALVQWAAYAGCILGASLVARELGGERRAQMIAAVLAAAIPSSILGASSTKNDCVLAYWVIVSVYLALRWRRAANWRTACALGCSVGLALFTKGTAYLLLPWLLAACAMSWDRVAWKKFLVRVPLCAAGMVAICLPLWIRNVRLSGSPLGVPYFHGVGSVENRRFENDHFSPAQIAADVARNLSLNVGVPSSRVNRLSEREISGLILHLGVDPNEPGQMSYRQSGEPLHFRVSFDPFDEFFSEDTVPLLLFLFACGAALVHWRRTGRALHWYAAGLVAAYLAFCALLRWAPSNERYLIPLIVPGSSFVAVMLVQELPVWAVNAVAGVALVLAFPLALLNQARPLLTRHGLQGSILTTPRDATYFFDNHQELTASFLAAAEAARNSGCRIVAIDANSMHFEYPMMALLQKDGQARTIQYAGVENMTARYRRADEPAACAVICLGCLHHPERMAAYASRFPKRESFGTLVLFTGPVR